MRNFFEKVKELNVLVVGDVMIDRYLNGRVSRISPEAPVPVVDQFSKEDRLGGAANVALNLHSLGATPILCGAIGHDHDASSFFRLLNDIGLTDHGIISCPGRATTVKTRIIADHQHLLRLDKEDSHEFTEQESGKFIQILQSIFATQPIDALILQDYNKGVLSSAVIEWVLAEAKRRAIPIAVDPKSRNFWLYQGVDIFKPNLKEVREALNLALPIEKNALEQAAEQLRSRLGYKHLLLTLSDKGVFLDSPGGSFLLPTRSRNVADVCGAGDAVVSVVALGLSLGLSMEKIALLSNLAGGQVVERLGVVPVEKEQLLEEMRKEMVAGNW